jgi:biopolymer transport protein ExbB/TolQ
MNFSAFTNSLMQFRLLGQDDAAATTDAIFNTIGITIYVVLGCVALWGAFCVLMVWRRVAAKRFKNESLQNMFLEQLAASLAQKDFEGAAALCERDSRAMVQLAYLAIVNRELGFGDVRQLLVDRFQRDVLADLENRMSWVNTVVKSAPMIGLFGTVIGILETFSKLGSQSSASLSVVAPAISEALIATAAGIAVAIFAYTFHLILKRKAYELSSLLTSQSEVILSQVEE